MGVYIHSIYTTDSESADTRRDNLYAMMCTLVVTVEHLYCCTCCSLEKHQTTVM